MMRKFLIYIIPVLCLFAFWQNWTSLSSVNEAYEDVFFVDEKQASDNFSEEQAFFPYFETILSFSRPVSGINAQRLQNGQRRIDTLSKFNIQLLKVCKHTYSRCKILDILNLKFSSLSKPSFRLLAYGKLII